MVSKNFQDVFTDNLYEAAGALEDGGYSVESFAVYPNAKLPSGAEVRAVEDTPEDALNQFCENLSELDDVWLHMDGEELASTLQEDDPILPSTVYKSVYGSINVEDPQVDVDWHEEKMPAINTVVQYVPDLPDNDHFRVGIVGDAQPYDTQDQIERRDNIMNILEEKGFNTKFHC